MLYWLELDMLRSALSAKRPSVVNQYGVILHYDIARPHSAIIALRSNGVWLGPPSVFSDLMLTDYHLFYALNSFFNGKIWWSEWCKITIEDIFELQTSGHLPTWIHHLPERWQEVMPNMHHLRLYSLCILCTSSSLQKAFVLIQCLYRSIYKSIPKALRALTEYLKCVKSFW